MALGASLNLRQLSLASGLQLPTRLCAASERCSEASTLRSTWGVDPKVLQGKYRRHTSANIHIYIYIYTHDYIGEMEKHMEYEVETGAIQGLDMYCASCGLI